MQDRKIKKMFERELEIPDVVQEKVYEAYQKVGADMKKAAEVSVRNRRRNTGMRYVKAASFLMFALIAATTVHAAANGGFEKLSKLFDGDVSQIQSSSVTPKISSEKNTFKDLKVSVEQAFGTEELAYLILRIKRTDGKKFDKNKNYHFRLVGMKGENDFEWQEEEQKDGAAGSNGRKEERECEREDVGATVILMGDEGDDISVEDRYANNGMVIENNGTDEICLAVMCGYEQVELKEGTSRYHKGEKCRLKLSELCGSVDGKVKERIDGTAEAEFVLDYDDCQKKVCEPGKKIKMPVGNSETKYLPVGTLDRVMITPYFIRYEMTVDEKQSENYASRWDQIYVEMEDGSRKGYPTLDSWYEAESGKSGYGFGVNGKYREILMLPELIDVGHVKAVYFGKTRIEL